MTELFDNRKLICILFNDVETIGWWWIHGTNWRSIYAKYVGYDCWNIWMDNCDWNIKKQARELVKIKAHGLELRLGSMNECMFD